MVKTQSVIEKDLLEALEALTGLIQSCINVYGAHQLQWITEKAVWQQCRAAINRAKENQ